MSFLSDNVIPGNHGKVFETNATFNYDLNLIKTKIASIDGVKRVSINTDVFPKEFKIRTSKLVPDKVIEDAVISLGFHVIAKEMLPL
ncbi:hypothetical protein [Polaribacter sp. Hel1_85]|uniref:hypothetical protein n=1 Tax=Polaribacter sp. Hel1_85 TaxID=1250005 RepID=UPI00052C1FEF|nr:hypothetical protein [Polaribacter sp. Hel1_85]KGL63664.1 hypothetical protein PHEL85_0703 [Polaribacter sp. Hel1_85]